MLLLSLVSTILLCHFIQNKNNVRALIESEDSRGLTPIMCAAKGGHKATIETLISMGADCHHLNGSFENALMYAVSSGQREIVELLLGLNANPNVGTNIAPISIASKDGNTDIIELLLDNGACIGPEHTLSEGHVGPIEHALMAATGSGRMNVVELLLDRGADRALRTAIGCWSLTPAIEEGIADILHLLLSRGADPALCFERKDNLTLCTLHLAVCRRDPRVVELLLDAGVNVNHKQDDGTTALVMARKKGLTDIVNLLLAAGANDPDG